jgi:hypothetical protein
MDTPPNEDTWKVLRWAGYVYIPVAIVFILVYLYVSYRAKAIDESYPAGTSTSTSN